MTISPADHDRYGEGQYEDPTESTQTTDELPKKGARLGKEGRLERGDRAAVCSPGGDIPPW